MQDRPNIEMDPTLVDRGWRQMQSQLDEAMPVRKKRMFPWFFLLLFIGIGTSAGVYQFAQYEQSSNGELIEPPLQSVADSQINTPIAEVQLINETSEQEEMIEQQEAIEVAQSEAISVTQQPSIKTISTITAKIDKSQLLNTRYNGNTKIEPSTNVTNEIEETLLQEAIVVQEQTADNSVSASIDSDRTETSLLAKKDIVLLEQPKDILEEKIAFISPKAMRLYAMVETEIGLTGDPQGAALGLGLHKKLNNRIAIDLGANYQFVSAKLFSNVFKKNNEDDFLSADLNFYEQESYQLSQTYNYLKVQRVNLPIQLRIKMGNRWSLSAGVQTTYYTKAIVKLEPSQESIIGNPVGILNGSDLDLYRGISVFSVDRTTNAVSLPFNLKPNRWQWSTLLGAQYQISNKIEIEAKYRRNSTNWPSVTANFGAKSYLSVGLRYYLN